MTKRRVVTPVGRHVLVAIGAAAAAAAAADPRCAGREMIVVDQWVDVPDAFPGARGSALLVMHFTALTYQALNVWSQASVATATAFGVLPLGADGRLLGAGRPSAPPADHSGALYCHFRRRFDCSVEFGRDEVDGFLDRVTRGVEATVFHSHGNGADLQLGRHVICERADELRGSPSATDRTLPCQVGGPCRLSHLPIEKYWGASALRSRIVVLVSCWGYLPADGLLSPEALLGTALFRGPRVEAFIASTRVTYNTPELAQAALAFLELGGTAGELALLLNRFPGTASPPYVCVGDPQVRVQPVDGHASRHSCPSAEGGRPANRAPASAGLDFPALVRLEEATRHTDLPAEFRAEILAGFGHVLKDGRPGTLSQPAQDAIAVASSPSSAEAMHAAYPLNLLPDRHGRFRALTALVARHTGDLIPAEADAFWALMHGLTPASPAAVSASPAAVSASPTMGEKAPGAAGDIDWLDQQWCAIQARLLRKRGPDQLGYLSAVSRYRDERLDHNPGPAWHLCGNRMFRITVEFSAPEGYARELCYCERCGLVADVPVGMRAPMLGAGEGGLMVRDSPWRSAWMTAGIVSVGPSLSPASAPRRVDLAEPIPVPVAEPGRRYGVTLIHDGDHVIIQTPLPPFASHGGPAELNGGLVELNGGSAEQASAGRRPQS